jgi:hypothetical protein
VKYCSVKATKLLPYQRYLLYKPEASRQNVLFHSKHPSECNVTLCAGSAPGTSICTSETFTSTKSLGAGLDNRKVVDSSDVASLTESSSSTVLQGVAASCDTVMSCSSVLTDEVLSVPVSPSSDDVGDNSNDLPFDVDETVQEQINFDSTVELASIDTRVKTIADCLTTSEEMSAENRKRVAEFYSHSRLHYISTWCSDAKAHVARLQTEVGI